MSSSEVKIPAVGESITSGLLSTWHKKDGDQVQSGDILFTLETDKVSTEVVAERAGRLRITVPEGTEVKIGEVVATIDDAAAGAPAQATAAPAPAQEQAQPPATAAPVAPPKEETISAAPQPKPEPAVPAPAVDLGAQLAAAVRALSQAPAVQEQEPAAAPSVAPAPSLAPASTLAPAPAPAPADVTGRSTRKKLSPIRRKIAAQLVMAQQTAAILTTFNECDMSGIMELRSRIQPDFQKEHGIKLGFMSFFIKAAVKALQDVPAINGRMDGDDFIQNHYYDLGVAVGTERGLIVPVVRDADKKSFAEIEKDLAAYAQRAREGKIGIEDLQGGVFTISNGGVYGSLLSTPILNPPQSGILGMHKIQERPVAVKGQVVIRPMMYLALSYDHRVVDGKEAVTFLIKVKEAIEDPIRLLLEV